MVTDGSWENMVPEETKLIINESKKMREFLK